VLTCIDAGKPVLCEKPLAQLVEECIAVVRAEAAGGRHLVQLGFMRRFDPGYLEVKRAIDSGSIGTPLVLHCVHRNADVPPGFQTSMSMTDSAIHEFDVVRWLLDDDIAGVRVLFPRATPNGADIADPQLAIVEMVSGVIVTVEAFLTCGFGYEVRCEVVGSDGLATLDHPRLSSLTTLGARREMVADTWMTRFGDTYRIELQAWADAVRDGRSVGASAWDGYAATAAADAAVKAQKSGQREPVTMIERPAFYA